MQIDMKDTTLTISDGTGTPQSIEVKIGEGNLTWTEARNMEYTLDRGLLDEVREGDQIPVDVTFDFTWEYVTGTTGTAGVPTVRDALRQEGAASTWISSDTDVCRPYAVDLTLFNNPDCAAGDVEKTVLADFRFESLAFDLSAGTISCAGKCNITAATATRGSQT